MNSNVAYNTYAQNDVTVESPTKLIEMLYEGILRFNFQAKKAIEAHDVEKRTYWINRSSNIFTELMSTLNFERGDISYYLQGLYGYQLQTLAEVNINNDAEKLDQVNQVVKGLLEAWKEETNVAQPL